MRPDGNSNMTNPAAISRPTPTPRSITTLVTALRQSYPSRTSNQARTPSPATLGKTWEKNAPTAVTAITTARVIHLRAASASMILYQRRPKTGTSSMATSVANAAQRKSNKRIEDETWIKSICRKTYQKHAAVTRSFTAKIRAFLPPPPAGRLVVSRSLVTVVLTILLVTQHPPTAVMALHDHWEGCLCGIVMAEGNAKFKP